MELLLLPGGAAAAGLPVVVLAARAGGGLDRPRGALPGLQRLSVNIVSHEHVDVPFHNDAAVGVVEHVFAGDAARTIEEFHDELYSARSTPAGSISARL